jgi:hypothetical protein
MSPITFEETRFIPRPAGEIADGIADLSRWPAFGGYGPLPGIVRADYEARGEEMAGARIRVHDEDGASHVETVEVWEPPARIVLRLHGFTPPLSRLATDFLEEWRFAESGDGTEVTRRLDLYPRSALARPALWLISLLMRRAIARHLAQMAADTR